MTGEQIGEGRVCAGEAELGGGPRIPLVSPGLLGFSALEATIMELAWAVGGELSMKEIEEHLDQHRAVRPTTVRTGAGALVRRGHLVRSGRDGAWGYRAVRTPAEHLGQLAGRLLGASPDRASTLAGAGVTEAHADDLAGPGPRVVVLYDGCWYEHATKFFAQTRRGMPSVAGVHDAIRWHAAGLFSVPVQRVTISQAHFVIGQTGIESWWAQEMTDHGVVCHRVPVTKKKGEVGGDVELVLICYQIACELAPDLIVLFAGDGDLAPLVGRLAGRGLRVLVPVADFSRGEASAATAMTSSWLTRRATDTPGLAELLAAADGEDYPRFLARPFPATVPDGPPGRRRGIVTQWPPGGRFGFITDDEGRVWYANCDETPRHMQLSPGCPVTFTGPSETGPGQSRPQARGIVPQARRFGVVAAGEAEFTGRSDVPVPAGTMNAAHRETAR